jgi:hypothetical protein
MRVVKVLWPDGVRNYYKIEVFGSNLNNKHQKGFTIHI